jgi:hypothetical protein
MSRIQSTLVRLRLPALASLWLLSFLFVVVNCKIVERQYPTTTPRVTTTAKPFLSIRNCNDGQWNVQQHSIAGAARKAKLAFLTPTK